MCVCVCVCVCVSVHAGPEWGWEGRTIKSNNYIMLNHKIIERCNNNNNYYYIMQALINNNLILDLDSKLSLI